MSNIKVMISLNPNLLEAVDKVAKVQMKKRSELITEALRNYPDVYEVLTGLEEASKAVSNE